MFPPDTTQYRYNRLALKYDMPWEPWLHCAVWLGTIWALIFGERGIMPPIDGIDWYWIGFGLVSPVVGFFSVWTLEHHQGKPRYYALWGRMLADAGLTTAILIYLLDRHMVLQDAGVEVGVSNIVMFFAMLFTATLVARDLQFIHDTEHLAAKIYKDAHYLTIQEWVTEWGDDDNR